jgi:hypothetical protein
MRHFRKWNNYNCDHSIFRNVFHHFFLIIPIENHKVSPFCSNKKVWMLCLLGKSPWKDHHIQATILVKPMALGFIYPTFLWTPSSQSFFHGKFFHDSKKSIMTSSKDCFGRKWPKMTQFVGKGSPLGPSMLWGAPLCLRDGRMVLIFWLCHHPRALWYSYSDYAVIQGPRGTHIRIMPSSKGLVVLIFGLCCHPRALWYSYLDYAIIQGPYGTHIFWLCHHPRALWCSYLDYAIIQVASCGLQCMWCFFKVVGILQLH